MDMKLDAKPKAMRLFNVSAYDQCRIDWLIEGEVALGNRILTTQLSTSF